MKDELCLTPDQIKKKTQGITLVILFFSILIGLILGILTWDMNYWPTDTEGFYMPAAAELSNLQYISQIHQSVDTQRRRWLHGKEATIFLASMAQRFLHDTTTLRPFLLVCIVSVSLSGFLIYYIANNYWGIRIGVLCYFLFVTSFWPYLYILFTKHQPVGLLFFLLSVLYLQVGPRARSPFLLYYLSGSSLAFSLFASTISGLYAPYWLTAFFYTQWQGYQMKGTNRKFLPDLFKHGLTTLLGFLCILIFFTYPDIIKNINGMVEYLKLSQSYNHFYYHQSVLKQWIPDGNIVKLRGGWIWILKYYSLSLPVVFPLYMLCLSYLLIRCFQERTMTFRILTCFLIILSFSSPVLTEIKGIAEYGSNYFSFFPGALMLIAYAGYDFFTSISFREASCVQKRFIIRFLFFILGLHLLSNFYVFFGDVYPARMATTFLSRKIKQLNAEHIYTYAGHPLKHYMVDCLNPDLLEKVKLWSIDNIAQVKEGYILVPPMTGSSIYVAAWGVYKDFDQDLYLNALRRKKNLADYAIASFKTLASSRIWGQEEEILSYRDLILGNSSLNDKDKGTVWLLDAKKISQDIDSLQLEDDLLLPTRGIRNIGTPQTLYTYTGQKKFFETQEILENWPAHLYKQGNPQDSLVAYVYKVDPVDPAWIPVNQDYASMPLPAVQITSDPKGVDSHFHFSVPLKIEPGLYNIVIYRTGKTDDANFYRIDLNDEVHRQFDLRSLSKNMPQDNLIPTFKFMPTIEELTAKLPYEFARLDMASVDFQKEQTPQSFEPNPTTVMNFYWILNVLEQRCFNPEQEIRTIILENWKQVKSLGNSISLERMVNEITEIARNRMLFSDERVDLQLIVKYWLLQKKITRNKYVDLHP